MTQCARPSGPDACTESSDLFRRGFSRGGITFITWAAVASRAANFSSSSMSAVASMAAATIWGTPEHQGPVEDAAECLDVGDPRVAAVPDRVRGAAPGQSEPELVLPRDDQLVVAGLGVERLVGVLLEVVRAGQGGVEQDRLRGGDGRAAAPEDGDVEGVEPGLLQAISAAISPVVYICATPGASSRPAAAKSAPYCSSQVITQSCSPVVSR